MHSGCWLEIVVFIAAIGEVVGRLASAFTEHSSRTFFVDPTGMCLLMASVLRLSHSLATRFSHVRHSLIVVGIEAINLWTQMSLSNALRRMEVRHIVHERNLLLVLLHLKANSLRLVQDSLKTVNKVLVVLV